MGKHKSTSGKPHVRNPHVQVMRQHLRPKIVMDKKKQAKKTGCRRSVNDDHLLHHPL